MVDVLEIDCFVCSILYFEIIVGFVVYDLSLIELVIICSNCGYILNVFVFLVEMSVVLNFEEEIFYG